MSAPLTIALIGSVGVPALYGGFETFAEQVGRALVAQGHRVIVTCDAGRYADRNPNHEGLERVFISPSANGTSSVLHDLRAFLAIRQAADLIVVMGVSMGPFFPLLRLARGCCAVNLDGIEWRRDKWSASRRRLLKWFDTLGQRAADVIVIDNPALAPFVAPDRRDRTVTIAYGGDHVLAAGRAPRSSCGNYALSVCRIEPENNVELLIEGFLASEAPRYTFVGNWNATPLGRRLRARYAGEPRLELLDPVYEPEALHALRAGAAHYLHGHSVGGTNPSLVEMLFYDAPILAYDCSFNRATAEAGARYFTADAALTQMLDDAPDASDELTARAQLRKRYAWSSIAAQYAALVARAKPR